MPQVVAEIWVPLEPAGAFAVSQTTGEIRRQWDPFIRRQYLIDAVRSAKGVRTFTRTRLGPAMISEYAAFRPPTTVGITMISGPWFFARFGGGWRFTPESRDGVAGTRTVWRYTFSIRPSWLAPLGDRIGMWLLGREIRARIAAFARACVDPVVLDAVRAGLRPPSGTRHRDRRGGQDSSSSSS